MPGLKLTPSVRRHTGIVAMLLGGLATVASLANEVVAPVPLSLATANPAIREHIRAFEAGTGRFNANLLSFAAPDGQPVYLFISGCCDQFNRLYDGEGRFICAPSGGIAGSGDGRCPAWVQEMRARPLRLPASRTEPTWPPR